LARILWRKGRGLPPPVKADFDPKYWGRGLLSRLYQFTSFVLRSFSVKEIVDLELDGEIRFLIPVLSPIH
jgi:hypothetical protein